MVSIELTTLLGLDWIYDTLELDLDFITGIGLILLYTGLGLIKWIIQALMPLEKYEKFLKLSAKQWIIQSSPISLSQIHQMWWMIQIRCLVH